MQNKINFWSHVHISTIANHAKKQSQSTGMLDFDFMFMLQFCDDDGGGRQAKVVIIVMILVVFIITAITYT